jgi:hypothetical protein
VSFIATAVGTKVAIAALSLVAIGGGTAVAAAAATGGFPTATQTEDATDTPSATPTDDGTESPEPTTDPTPSTTQGPDATGPAAFGLCTAYAHGGLNSGSVAYAALLSASTSAGSIADYCAPILAANGSGAHKPSSEQNSSADHGQSGSEHGSGSHGTHGH